MKIQVEDLSPIRKKLIIEVEPEKVKEEWGTVYRGVSKKVKMKGFRPGKVPRSLVERYYGPQIEEEVIRNLVSRNYPEALKESQLIPITMPQLDQPALDPEGPFTFQATIELKPEINISEYKGLSLNRQEAVVKEEDVENRLSLIQRSHGVLSSLKEDRPLQQGDFAVIDYESWLDDRPLPDGSATNYDLEVGSGYFNTDFEKELLGLKKGDTREFEIQFPETHGNALLAGKRIKYSVILKEIKERILPELDDEFAKGLQEGFFASLEDLKAKIREDLKNMEKQRAEAKLNEELLEQLMSKTEFEIPESLVDLEMEGMMARMEQDMTRRGMTWPQNEADRNRIRENMKPVAQKRVRRQLILERIAALESLEVNQEELEAEFAKIAQGVNQSAGFVREVYQKNNMLPQLSAQLLEEKTLTFLKDQAQITHSEDH
jgi:trigger factor